MNTMGRLNTLSKPQPSYVLVYKNRDGKTNEIAVYGEPNSYDEAMEVFVNSFGKDYAKEHGTEYCKFYYMAY